jgi:acetolactate decarboxylase
MSELEFLGALHVELLRHRQVGHDGHAHEVFQASTVGALLDGGFDGDLTLAELLEHGDLGLGTLNGLDGELIVIDGQAFKAKLDCTLTQPELEARTPYAVVVPFSAGEPVPLTGPLEESQFERQLLHRLPDAERPVAVRIDGRFGRVRVRSVPRQQPPYPRLAEAIDHQHVRELTDVLGTAVGFCFPDPLKGIELLGWHLHFATVDRALGGHILACRLDEGLAYVDELTELHVELPPAVEAQDDRDVDQVSLRRLETGE